MEKLLQWLPERPQPLFVRYGATAIIVLACFALLKWVEWQSGVSSFFLMYPAIFLSALLFDRGSGFIATALSTVLLILSIQSKGDPTWPAYGLPLTLFVVVGLGLALLTELLRKGWERAIEAERAKDLLYRELSHRTKNDFTMAASVLNLQARSQTNEEVRQALKTAVGRLLSLSKAHERLNPLLEGQGGGVQMDEYLEALCHALKDSLGQMTDIELGIESDDVKLPAGRAIPVGLIVNELVTNALKHAFAGRGEGSIRVALRNGEMLTLFVEDNGIGCAEGAASGVGSQLVQLLVQQLDGSMERTSATPGCRVRVTFPETN